MKQLYPLFGIVTVLNTPFTAANELDLDGLRRHVYYALDAGVAGFLVPALASEVYKLSLEERLTLVETTLDACAGRAPVIGGAGELDGERRRQVVADLLRIGCSEVLLQIPFSDEAQYSADVHRIADMGPEMIMIQDWDFGGGGLPIALIARLFEEVEAFRCLKIETVPAGVKYSAVLEATGGRLNISGGWAVANMLEGLARGVHAFMPTALHELYTLIYELYRRGERSAARDWFYKILPILAFSNQHLDISIHFFKRLLHRQGIYTTANVRSPSLPFDRIHQQETDNLIDYALALMAEARPLLHAAYGDVPPP